MGIGKGHRPRDIWFKASAARRLRLPVELPLALLETRHKGGRCDGYVFFAATAETPLEVALSSGSVTGHSTIRQIRHLLQTLSAARIRCEHLALDGLAWDGERVYLLDVAGMRFLPYWQRQPAAKPPSALVHGLARSLQLQEGTIEAQLAGDTMDGMVSRGGCGE